MTEDLNSKVMTKKHISATEHSYGQRIWASLKDSDKK